MVSFISGQTSRIHWANLSSLHSETLTFCPLSLQPWPLIAVKVFPMHGAEMMPSTIFLLIANATEMVTRGLLWTKFIVPSMGSIIHVGLSVKVSILPSAAATLSSPMNSCLGKLFLKKVKINWVLGKR